MNNPKKTDKYYWGRGDLQGTVVSLYAVVSPDITYPSWIPNEDLLPPITPPPSTTITIPPQGLEITCSKHGDEHFSVKVDLPTNAKALKTLLGLLGDTCGECGELLIVKGI